MFKTSIAALAVLCTAFTISQAVAQDPEAKPKPHAFQIQDNEFRYEYSSWYRDPFISTNCATAAVHTCPAQNLGKNVLGFTHVDLGNKLGDNTFDVQLMMDNTRNPVSVAHFHDSTNVGSKDFYTTFRHDFVLDRLVNRSLAVGPIKNWIITVGADLAEKNDDFGNQRRSPMAGPGVNFKVPNGGYWKVTAMWTREWNNEGTDVTSWWYQDAKTGTATTTALPCFADGCIPVPKTWGQKVVYSPREVTLQTAWGVPFALGRAPIIFEGFSTLNTAKGYGASQLVPFTGPAVGAPAAAEVWYKMGTRPEWYTHARLMYNFGSLLEGSHVWQVGVGYEYWHNEFGVGQNTPIPLPSSAEPGTYQCTSCIGNTPFLSVAIHL